MFGFKKMENLNKEVEKLNKEVAELNKIKRNLEEEKNWLISNNRELKDESRDLRNEIEKLNKNKENMINDFNDEVRNLRNEIEKINENKEKMINDFNKERERKIKCLDLYRKDIKEMEELLNSKKDESDRLDEIEKIIKIRERDINELSARRDKLIKSVSEIEKEYENKKKELEEVKQLIEGEYVLEEVDLNTLPKYDFANSSLCKDELERIREKEKEMVRNNTAVICKTDWTVNGSISKGRKMINDKIKMNLKSFNNGCDYIISSMKYSTYNSSLNKINKLFNDINRLSTTNDIEITKDYLNLKLEELDLAFVYAELKEEEKEEQRRIREQMREEAKRQAELEEKRKAINKEQQHYENELKRALERNRDAELIKKLRERIAELENSKKDVDKLEATVKAGYVYIISNEGSFGENCYKIGTTRRLNPLDRVDELGNASVPFRFDVHALIFSEDCFELESKLHKIFDAKRVNKVNKRKEFFNVTLDEIVEVVNNQLGLNVEFTLEAIAREYRESKAM